MPPILASFIGGLGGRDISTEEFFEIATTLKTAIASGATPPPRLLYTEDEIKQIEKLQMIAQVERMGDRNE
jgi:pyruvate ferredoxin oxidoreductase alpha subunit